VCVNTLYDVRSRLTTHFSERIPVVKRRMSVINTYGEENDTVKLTVTHQNTTESLALSRRNTSSHIS